MNAPFVLYGWHLSYFTGKALCYLRYKQVPFELKAVNLFTLMHRIKRETGASVMPVLVTPQGQWIQDTSRIIDHVEAIAPGASVHPTDPVQRFASYLMEAWGDEWWIPMAMHTRWTYPENYALFEREAGDALLPGFPRAAKNRAVGFVAARLRGMLPAVGVRPEQFKLMDDWMDDMLDHLDQHFARHRFLFGNRPMLGDFGLVGSLYAHLGRDPWPARELVALRPHLRAWIDRMTHPEREPADPDEPLGPDPVPETLLPVYRAIAREFVPLLEGIHARVQALMKTWPPGKPLPRSLGDVEVPMGSGCFRRAAIPYTLWMAQRTLDVYRAMTPAEQAAARAWLRSIGGERLLDLDLPRLRLHGVRVAVEPG